MSTVAKRLLRSSGGVGRGVPNPEGPGGSTRLPSHAGRRVTQRLFSSGGEVGEGDSAGSGVGEGVDVAAAVTGSGDDPSTHADARSRHEIAAAAARESIVFTRVDDARS